MSERAAYSRVYWSIVDDAKFVSIYDDDHHLAAWLRLLLIADQAHPASAHLPSNVRRASVRALSDVGLIDVTAGRYRIRGLDAERERRSAPAKGAASARWAHSERTPDAMRTHSERSARPESAAILDETRLDETRHRAGARGTNGKIVDEREWTEEQRQAHYIAAQAKRTGVP